MNETYAPGARDEEAAGQIILVIAATLSALLVIAALVYALGTGQRHQAGLAADGCEPGLAPSGQQCTTQPMLRRQYLAIETPASQQLKVDVAAYSANEDHNLAAAEAALTAEVTSQHAFDVNLAAMALPPAVTPVARALDRAGQARAQLVAEQAGSTSLAQLRSFNHRVQVANAAVATQLKALSMAIDAPLPAA